MIRKVGKQVLPFASFLLLLFLLFTGGPSGSAESTYQLVGTIESKEFIGAVIITPDGKQAFYRLRETLPDGAKLVQVHSDSISVQGSDGTRYDMFITASGRLQAGASPGMQAVTPPQSEYPADKDRQARPSRRSSGRSSSREE